LPTREVCPTLTIREVYGDAPLLTIREVYILRRPTFGHYKEVPKVPHF